MYMYDMKLAKQQLEWAMVNIYGDVLGSGGRE
jgi:hypothetical protein